MWSTAIFEIKHNGNGGGEVVWERHLWDHLIQDADPNDDNYGIVSEHPELFDVNVGTVGGGGGPGGANADWMHINAISYNAEYDQIVISSRHQCEIFVIDHSTTTEEAAGHNGGNSGKGGDFLYRWGNPQNYDRGNNSDNLIFSIKLIALHKKWASITTFSDLKLAFSIFQWKFSINVFGFI